MKRMGTIMLAMAGIIFLAGCNPEDETNAEYKTGYMYTGGNYSHAGFDFSEGAARHDTLADLIVEPWWNNGQPAPAIMSNQWGDSTKKLIDLGRIDIQDAIGMDLASLSADTTTQSDMWTVDSPQSGHSYYITTREGLDAFFIIDSLKIEQQDSIDYTAKLWIHYYVKE